MDGPEMTRTTPSSLPSALMGTAGMSLARIGCSVHQFAVRQFAVRHSHAEMKSCVSQAVMNLLAVAAAEEHKRAQKMPRRTCTW